MFNPSAIAVLNARRAERYAKRNRKPYIVEHEDVVRWHALLLVGEVPNLPFPELGRFVPKGWTVANVYTVDGEDPESVARLIGFLVPGLGYTVDLEALPSQVLELERDPTQKHGRLV